MKKLIVGQYNNDNIYYLVDPTQYVEIDFEAEVVKAFTWLLPDYICGVFSGSFILDGERRVSDLALIHKSFSHWFVIEVEIAGHSLEHHVMPQVRCFRYGEPELSCITSLTRGFDGLETHQAEILLRFVPRHVLVVGNLYDSSWSESLRANDIQYITVSVYRNRNGDTAHEVDGQPSVRNESIGFASYSAIDNCLRISKNCGLPVGRIQIIDQFGNNGDWTILEKKGVLWITKDRGPTLINHESYVQLIRSVDGKISLLPSS